MVKIFTLIYRSPGQNVTLQILLKSLLKMKDQDEILKLVKSCQKGNKEAFEYLYDEFSERIYAFIRIKVTDRGLAEDLLQDVFMKAWKSMGKLKHENLNFSAWLYKICSCTVNDYYRKIYRTPQVISLSGDEKDLKQSLTEKDAIRSIDLALMRKKMLSLPVDYRQVIELRCIQEFSIQETADIMEKNPTTIRVLLHRALKKLESLYDKRK